jgi:omega-6 fatty acid desaturase (delta-12 desaturase)
MSSVATSNPWCSRVRPWRRPSDRIALWQVASTLGLWIAAWTCSAWLWRRDPFLALTVVPIHAALMVRLFVLMHDCSHHSLFATRRANDLVGFWLGALFLTPHREWRRSHAIHHATASCLAKRNPGDIYTMTEDEYAAAPARKRLAYRLKRNPVIMLGLGPIVVFLIKQRFKGSLCAGRPHGRRWLQLQATTLSSLALGAGGCLLLGAAPFLTIWSLSFSIAGAAGIFLFYLQHNFHGAYYARDRDDYSFDLAGLVGASFLDLPGWAHWCTGNIGYHHIHHLDPLIPNYRLRACHRALFQDAPVKRLRIREAVGTLRLKLLAPGEPRMLTWSDWKRRQAQRTRGALSSARFQ